MAVASTTLRPRCDRRDGGPLGGKIHRPEQRPHAAITGQPALERGLRAADLALAGQEDQHPAVGFRHRLHDRSAVAASSRAPLASGASRQRMSTGWARPRAVITGASPISAATGPASSVADITNSARSSRSAPASSRHSASPRSALSERSWNSSKITAPTPDSSGSDWIIRVSTPSVTTSMRVLSDVLVAPRMR